MAMTTINKTTSNDNAVDKSTIDESIIDKSTLEILSLITKNYQNKVCAFKNTHPEIKLECNMTETLLLLNTFEGNLQVLVDAHEKELLAFSKTLTENDDVTDIGECDENNNVFENSSESNNENKNDNNIDTYDQNWRQIRFENTMSYMASKGGHLDVLIWLIDNGCSFSRHSYFIAAKKGYIHILNFFHPSGFLSYKYPLDIEAFEILGITMEDVNFLRKFAAGEGRVEVLRWINKNLGGGEQIGISYNGQYHSKSTCWIAAKNGQKQALKWLRHKEYVCSCDDFDIAAVFGHKDIVKWAFKINHPWIRRGTWYRHLVNYAHLDILKWACDSEYDYTFTRDECLHMLDLIQYRLNEIEELKEEENKSEKDETIDECMFLFNEDDVFIKEMLYGNKEPPMPDVSSFEALQQWIEKIMPPE